MANFDDAFLQTYMQGNAERAQAQQAARQFAWQNLWTQAKLQQDAEQERARLAQQTAYQNALIADTQAKQRASEAKDVLEAYRNGAVPAQPVQQAASLMNATAQPSLPLSNPLERAGLQGVIPPAGAVTLGGQMLRQQTPQELQALAAQQRQRAIQQGQSDYDKLLQAGILSPEAHRQLSALNVIQGGNIGKADAGTIQNIIAPKPPTFKEGDEPLGEQQAKDLGTGLLKRIQVLDPSIKELPPELALTGKTTRAEYAQKNAQLSAIENAKALKAQRDIGNQNAQDSLDIRRQLADISRQREEDRVATEAEKIIGGPRNASDYGHSYLDSGQFTGAGDEALMERYFDAVKPETGFRQNQAQMQMTLKLQNLKNSGEAFLAHLTGGTLFSNQLRRDIVKAIDDTYEAKKASLANKGKATPVKAPAVPAVAPASRPPLSSFGK